MDIALPFEFAAQPDPRRSVPNHLSSRELLHHLLKVRFPVHCPTKLVIYHRKAFLRIEISEAEGIAISQWKADPVAQNASLHEYGSDLALNENALDRISFHYFLIFMHFLVRCVAH